MTTKLEDLFGPDNPEAEFGSPKGMSTDQLNDAWKTALAASRDDRYRDIWPSLKLLVDLLGPAVVNRVERKR
jgi:hypothetical protein